MEGDDPAAHEFGIETVGKALLDAVALLEERQRPYRCRDVARKPDAVALGLHRHLGQSCPLGLHLDHPDRLTIDVEPVVGGAEATLQRKHPHRDDTSGGEIDHILVLDGPSSRRQGKINVLAFDFLRRFHIHCDVQVRLCWTS